MLPPVSICAHCGLPLRAARVSHKIGKEERSFCCPGCAFVYQLAGGGEAGESSESLLLVMLALGILLSGFIMTFSWVLYLYLDLPAPVRIQLQFILFGLTTPVIFGLGYPYFRIAGREIPHGRLSMASLIALGTMAAYIYSGLITFERGQHVYFDTASMVIVLVTLGNYLHARARARMARAMRQIKRNAPAHARRITNGLAESVLAGEIRVGDVLQALPAEQIAVDGTILEGRTIVDESILTGESLPVSRAPGDRVLQGSINLDGAILYQAIRVGEATLQAQIERMCSEAIGSRMPLQSLVDNVSAWFVGGTLTISALVLTYYGLLQHRPTDGFLYALAVLVVACPCALGIATPIATFVALQRAAHKGVLIRAPESLEKLSKIKAIVFDKTGTLTEGKLRVVDIVAAELPGDAKCSDPTDLLQIAASLEACSEHHLGSAIMQEFKSTGRTLCAVSHFVNHPGEGIEGTLIAAREEGSSADAAEPGKGLHVYLGTPAALAARGLAMPQSLLNQKEGTSFESRAYIGWEGWIRGVFRLQDQLRPNAKEVIEQCKRQGLEVHLLSGDREECVQETANALGIRFYLGETLPWQKVEYIQALKANRGCKVAMVGDGLNDAPALAIADIGIAHQVSTDLTKEAADIHILAGDLTLVPWALTLARKTFRRIQQNLFWAFIYNFAAITLAATGHLKPVMAAAAMLVSSMLVVGNSLRLEKVAATSEIDVARPLQNAHTIAPVTITQSETTVI